MSGTATPLVSCIMPTRDRPGYVAHALAYFRRQSYPARELIVLDDGQVPVAGLMPDDPAIRYQRLDKRLPLGAKRNRGCALARGELIVHWDDDDWMAPWRLAYQVAQILAAEADICGLDTLLFHDPGQNQTWRYRYPAGARPWVAGGTLCYRKAFWEQNRFPDLDVGEDTRFVWSKGSRRGNAARILALADDRFYVALIHAANTSPKRCRGSRWQAWAGDLAEIMGADLARYQRMPATRSGRKDSPRALSDGAGNQGDNNVAQPLPNPPAGKVEQKRSERKRGEPMKLNLGCCDRLLPGYVNVDLVAAPGVTVADLRERWPWPKDSVDEIRAWDIIEHLPDKVFTMNELWRVLRPGGRAEIAVPTTDGSGAWQDPTHVSFWNRRSFLYYEAGNPYRERFARHYGIEARFRTVGEQVERTADGPRLRITLEAVKG